MNCFKTCFPTIFNPDESEQRRNSRSIDKELLIEKYRYKRLVKILLLGIGESGKSTFLKQMRIIHGANFDESYRDDFKFIIYQNIVRGMCVLLDAREKLKIPWGSSNSIALGSHVMSIGFKDINAETFRLLSPYIAQLWHDSGIQKTYHIRSRFQLADSVSYFFQIIHTVSQLDYSPSNYDILLARKSTKGVAEFETLVNNIPFVFVDVGGQRSQRTKWLICFQNVTSVIFFIATSEFDKVILEDRQTNRLKESCNVFDSIVNNRLFNVSSIILFLNKTDLLREKLSYKNVSIVDHFPDFKGDPYCINDVQKFILDMFSNFCHNRSRPIYHHHTTAIDTDSMKMVFKSVKDTILQHNLNSILI